MRKGRLLILSLVATLIALGLVGPAGAAGKTYGAALTGAEEVPPRTTTAAGRAVFEVSDDGMSIKYAVTVTSINNLIMGHIHIGKLGENGPVAVDLVAPAQPGGGVKSGVVGEGTITASMLKGPLAGMTLTDLIAAMDAGNAYVNLHTNDGVDPQNSGPGDYPGGELRGQIRVATATPGMPNTGAGGMGSSLSAGWLALSAVIGLGAAVALETRRRAQRSR